MTNIVFPTGTSTKANPVDADILLIADSEDNNALKDITIGSITADIADGIINDSSASSTTTYSSTKIAADNATQDAALTAGLALKVAKAGDTMTGQLKLAKGADIASATTTDLGAATGNYVDVTGTTTITGLGTVAAGTTVTVRFTGILTLTYNATSLILPTGASITTAAGDVATFTSLGSGNWRCTSYLRADGTALGAVNITGLTEDTTGDMDADFALVYDNSAGANRKQKVNVFRATDSEAEAGSSTTKFIAPSQLDKYSVSTSLRSDWHTIVIPIISTSPTTVPTGWAGSVAGASDYYTAAIAGIQPSGSSSYAELYTLLPGSGSTRFYQFGNSKRIRVKLKLMMSSAGSANREGFGICVTTTAIDDVYNATTTGTIRFIRDGANTLYAANANGTATTTNISSGLTLTNWNEYEFVYTPGVDIKFYVNGTLKATHATNLPTNASDTYFCFGTNTNGLMDVTGLTVSFEN